MAFTGHSARILASPQLQALAGSSTPPLPFLRGTLTPALAWYLAHVLSMLGSAEGHVTWLTSNSWAQCSFPRSC